METEMAKSIETDNARQGHWGRHVLMVLIGGLALAMVAWAVAEMYGENIDQNATRQAVQSQ